MPTLRAELTPPLFLRITFTLESSLARKFIIDNDLSFEPSSTSII